MASMRDRRVHLSPRRPGTPTRTGFAHRSGLTHHEQHMNQGETMTAFAPHRDTVDAFVDSMHGGAHKDALFAILAEDVVMYGPLGDEPVTGREAVLEAMQGVGT